jgi:polysaccharide export outer membrane protein
MRNGTGFSEGGLIMKSKALLIVLLTMAMCWQARGASAPKKVDEYVLGSADVLHITVFGNPELTTDVRVSETGSISFPLIGTVSVVGLTLSQAEASIAGKLRDGAFVKNPQVNILPTQIVGTQVTVLGHVNKPGRYPLPTADMRVSDVLAEAGGVDPVGGDTVILIQHHEGQITRKVMDVTEIFVKGSEQDELLQGGDTLYLPRESIVYIYGEVQKPGSYRLERHMTLMQALAVGGYSIEKASSSRTQVYRQDEKGVTHEIELNPTDLLQPNDVIYVRLRIF